MATKKKKATQKKKKGGNSFKTALRFFWAIFALGILSVITLFSSVALGLLGQMPELQQLENPKTNLATQILSNDGVVLGKFYFNDNRTSIAFDALPKNLVNGLIATEDERFFSHSGIDLKGTLRALVYLGKKGGASTISQQLARQLFVGVRSRNKLEAVLQKFKEWVLAVQLERRYTKKEIIAMYLNIYDFGYSADGIQSAAKIYFNTTPKALRIEQSATLVGMLKNSSLFNPLRRPERVEQRRNVVLNQMNRNGFISEVELDSLKQIPLTIDYTPDSHREGLATYFRAYLQQFMRKWTKNNPKPDGTKYDIFRDGLRIFTTLDSRLQEIGEKAVNAHMANLQEEFFLQNTPEANPTAPFLDLREGEIDTLLQNKASRSERWRKMRASGKDEDAIWASFQKPVEMEVFSWKGDRDTLMSPLHSI